MAYYPDLAIDLEKLIAQKAPGAHIPGFVLGLLRRFLRLDFINAFLTRGYEGAEFCRECLNYLDVKIDVEGLENLDLLPEDAKCTVASNHPLGGIDGIAILGLVSERFNGRLKLLVNDFLMAVKGISSVCIPVNMMGGQSRDLRAQIDAAFDSDAQVMIFPAGACSRKIDGRVQDYPWRKTFLSESVRTGRYIVPIHFMGENSKSFYRVANFCKRFNIKFNLAMLMLPNEMYKGQHKRFKIIIGKPIEPSVYDSSRSPYQWAQEVRKTVYDL